MQTDLFDYELPKACIAQTPASPRDTSKLLILDRQTGSIQHEQFFHIGSFLHPGDLLIVNESKVFNARLIGTIAQRNESQNGRSQLNQQSVEIFLLRSEDQYHWLALMKPGKRIRVHDTIHFDSAVACTVQEKRNDGTALVAFNKNSEELLHWTDTHGSVPLPPYIESQMNTSSSYQTIYAKTIGSVAAPTAGFHFTRELIETLKAQGVRFASVTLHVGLGTFRPIQTKTIEEHQMHDEQLSVPAETRACIEETKRRGGRVIAVGTTTVRALESGISDGFTRIFITPGFRFKTVDALITNFHLPKSTLLMLVSAFCGEHQNDTDNGRKLVLHAYEEAKQNGYRFYSFGDAMFIK